MSFVSRSKINDGLCLNDHDYGAFCQWVVKKSIYTATVNKEFSTAYWYTSKIFLPQGNIGIQQEVLAVQKV